MPEFMSSFITALGQHSFLQMALAAGLLASVACGLVGSLVVVKRIAYLAGGLAHMVLGGMGVAVYFHSDPMIGAVISALVCALLIAWVSLHWQSRQDTVISAMWAIGMATGILCISQTQGYQVNLMSYLFGNILLVGSTQLWLMALIDGILIAAVLAFYKSLEAVAFDEEYARLRGIPVTLFYILLLCMVALTVVLLLQVVGLIMVIALLTLPAAIASHFCSSLIKMMGLATLLGAGFTTGGLMLSWEPDLPAGASIVVLAGAGYLFALMIRWLWQKRQHLRLHQNTHQDAHHQDSEL